MISAELNHNPYLLTTTVKFNEQDPKINSQIEKYEKMPLKEWIHLVPEIYYNEMNGYDFNLYFIGTKSDYDELKNAFSDKGITEDDVRIFHKNVIEDANTKKREVDELILWLKNKKNRRFDFEKFWIQREEQFEERYPYIMIGGVLPAESDLLLSIEVVENANELKNIDLTSIPIVFYIDDTKSEFISNLNYILKRQDVRMEQLFFMVNTEIDRAQITRFIRDLGVEQPQVIETYNDDLVMKFIRNYPITEFVRNAIQLFRPEVERITKILEIDKWKSEIVNADIYREINVLDKDIEKLKESDMFFVQRNNYEAPYSFIECKKVFMEQIPKWKNRKTKIIGKTEIEIAANDLIEFVQRGVDDFISSITQRYRDAWNEICTVFLGKYREADINIEHNTENVMLPEIQSITIPEMKSELLDLIVYEEEKMEFFGFRIKMNDTTDPVKVETCYLEKWRIAILNRIEKILDQYIDQCVGNLCKCYDLLGESYHEHLTQLIAEKIYEKQVVSEQLSDDERNLQGDNDWLSEFKEQLQRIERN